MSLSRFYSNQGAFIPEKLVPRPPKETDNWQPVNISEDPREGEFSYSQLTRDQDIREEDNPTIQPDNPVVSLDAESIPPLPDDAPPPEPVPPRPLPDLDKLQEDAFKAGVTEGLKQAESDFGSGSKALSQACELLSNIRDTILKNSKTEMIDLIITLSEKIIRHSVAEQNQTIINTVEQAILQAVKSSEFHIYLHPDDMEIIQHRSKDLISRVNGLENIVVKTDPSIERGGCKIESDNCTIDATLASQLEIIHKRIKEES